MCSISGLQNFLYMLDASNRAGYKPNPRLSRALDILFLLHAEHELNCSTSAARHLASSGVDVYTAVQGAVGALYGPLHGGANEAVLRMLARIGHRDNVPAFIEGVKARKEIMFGFGHRVYKNYDPRAKIIREVADEVFSIVGRDPLIEVAMELERVARSDEYFIKRWVALPGSGSAQAFHWLYVFIRLLLMSFRPRKRADCYALQVFFLPLCTMHIAD